MERRTHLVLIDDDPAIVRLLTTVIEKRLGDRLVVTGLTDSVQAREQLDRDCCDILISDLEMPGIDGLELLSFAKRRNAWTQVIFVTGHSTWDRLSEALERGATDYLLKPVDHDELIELVQQLCVRISRWRRALHTTLASANKS